MTHERMVRGRDFEIRPGEERDAAFIRDSWRRSYSDPPSDFAIAPDLDTFFRCQKAAIEMALAGGEVLVACDPDPEHAKRVALGWICFKRPNVLHYVYVKEGWKGVGLGRALFDAAFPSSEERIFASHVHTVTATTKLVVRHTKKGPDHKHPVPSWWMFGRRIQFNPFLVLS